MHYGIDHFQEQKGNVYQYINADYTAIYVNEFAKINPNHTRFEIQFMG